MEQEEQKIKAMSSFLKQLLIKDSWIKELIADAFNKDKINKKIKNIHLIDNKLLVSFWKKYSVYDIDVYNLWKEFRNISLSNMNLINIKDYYQILLSMEVSIFLIRLIKLENKFDFNGNYDFLDYQYIQLHDIFNSLVNALDKLNLVPIQMNLTERNKEKALKISKVKKWTEFDMEDFQFLNQVKRDYFKNRFYKKTFNAKIDKINFYENYLSEIRNQITHYPIVNHELKSNEETSIILLSILNSPDSNTSIKTGLVISSFKQGIILATLYLFLVYEEMLKIDIKNIGLFC